MAKAVPYLNQILVTVKIPAAFTLSVPDSDY
jgi:hypothetical protein